MLKCFFILKKSVEVVVKVFKKIFDGFRLFVGSAFACPACFLVVPFGGQYCGVAWVTARCVVPWSFWHVWQFQCVSKLKCSCCFWVALCCFASIQGCFWLRCVGLVRIVFYWFCVATSRYLSSSRKDSVGQVKMFKLFKMCRLLSLILVVLTCFCRNQVVEVALNCLRCFSCLVHVRSL